jgi:hypothetical protein
MNGHVVISERYFKKTTKQKRKLEDMKGKLKNTKEKARKRHGNECSKLLRLEKKLHTEKDVLKKLQMPTFLKALR